MKALVVYSHPRDDSFNAGIRDLVLEKLNASGADVRLHDLYARGFNPVMSAQEHRDYEDVTVNQKGLEAEIEDLLWCDTIIFVYPTWWYGPPTMLKGWLERVLVPDVGFVMPKADGETIRPGLTHITKLGVFTTCGASRLLTFAVGAPGKRTLMRGFGWNMVPFARKFFAAHYLMDSSTPESRAKHLKRVGRKMDRLIASRAPKPKPIAR